MIINIIIVMVIIIIIIININENAKMKDVYNNINIVFSGSLWPKTRENDDEKKKINRHNRKRMLYEEE